jgi:hypothetical protein
VPDYLPSSDITTPTAEFFSFLNKFTQTEHHFFSAAPPDNDYYIFKWDEKYPAY